MADGFTRDIAQPNELYPYGVRQGGAEPTDSAIAGQALGGLADIFGKAATATKDRRLAEIEAAVQSRLNPLIAASQQGKMSSADLFTR